MLVNVYQNLYLSNEQIYMRRILSISLGQEYVVLRNRNAGSSGMVNDIKHVAIHIDEAEMHVDLEDSGKTMAMAQAVWYRETDIKSLTLDIRLSRFPGRVIKDRRRGIPLEQG
jgi:hypothetical protein